MTSGPTSSATPHKGAERRPFFMDATQAALG